MRFYSKKNIVVKGEGKVIKTFATSEGFKRERIANLTLSNHLVPVPKILDIGTQQITYEFVDGNVYADIVDDLTPVEITALLNWLNSFHMVLGTVHPDLNLRNFICRSDGSCVGIDFEDLENELVCDNSSLSLASNNDSSSLSFGNKFLMEKDMGKLIAFVGTYEPVFTERKISICREISSIGLELFSMLNTQHVQESYSLEVSDMLKRRANPGFTINDSVLFIKKVLTDY